MAGEVAQSACGVLLRPICDAAAESAVDGFFRLLIDLRNEDLTYHGAPVLWVSGEVWELRDVIRDLLEAELDSAWDRVTPR